MSDLAGSRRDVGSEWLDKVFDCKSSPAQAAHQLAPGMQELDCPAFPVRAIGHLWQRPLVIEFDSQNISIFGVSMRDLQACWLFVLTDVQSARSKDPGHLAIDGAKVRHIAGADRLMDDVETRRFERRQIIHRRFDEP